MPLSPSEETDHSAGEKKRRRTVRLLPLHDKVEVRSEEEGFLGSWHPGTVIACFKERWQVNYKFKYDHILREDKSDFLVGSVDVSLFVDGNIGRGYIRPLPPPLEFDKWILSYGLCVDVSFNEAWWEGVIFDHDDGSDKRKVFFPDLGDEVIARLDAMRITQDWNQVTGQWKQRGLWLFLELIEEYEQVRCLPVSVKQLWYDLREKEGFQKLGGWTSCASGMWQELLVDTINDNLKLVLEHLFQETSLPQGMNNLTKLAKLVSYSAISAQVDSAGTVDPNDRRNRVGKEIISSPQNVESTSSLSESSTSCHVKACPLMLPDPLGSTFAPNATPIISIHTRNGASSRSSSQKISSTWRPVGSDIVPRTKFCPSAITEYANGNRRVVGDVRAHLVYMNWKIEFMRDKGIMRVRYTSPSGKCYSSLRQVCLEFSNSDSKDPSFYSVQEHRVSEDVDGNLCPLLEQPIEDHDSQISTRADAQSYVYLKPECCPKAIVNWYIFSGYDQARRKAAGKGNYHMMAKRARKHLAVEGWKFMYNVHNGRRELKHISPAGRSYYSLRRACKIYMQESGIDIPSGSIELDDIVVGGTKRDQEERTDGTNIPVHPHQTEDELDSHNVRLQHPSTGSSRTSIGSFKLKSDAIVTQPICRLSSKGAQETVVPTASHRNPRTVLSWLVDNKVVLPRAKVYYRSAPGECSIAEGRITRDGVKCHCCMKVYSLSRFQDHVGVKCISNYCGAASNIFLQDGRSLLDCQVQIMRDARLRNSTVQQPRILQERQEVEKNDYICSVCRYGGDLIMCDLCPSSFHQSCINMTVVPDGDWFCPSCCCRICDQQGLENNSESIVDEHMLNCTQCEHRYHISCLRNNGMDELEHHPNRTWFCSRNCEEIFSRLSALLGKPIPVGVENLTWTLLKFVESDSTGFGASTIEIQAQSYSKLNIALHLMHECFERLEEPRTRDIVEDVIFSKRSELRRLDFHGFYTVILEKDDEVITVATLRVFGDKAAEVPLIATRPQYRRLGMCHILLNELEKKLVELGVQRLVLPAVASMLNMWTGSFGFSKMTDSERLLFLDCTFVEFQETIMCHKQLMPAPSVLGSMQEIKHVASNPIFQISNDDHDLVASTPISDVVQDPVEEEVITEHEANDNVAGKVTTRSGFVHARDKAKHSGQESATEGSNGSTTLSTGTHEGGDLIKYYKKRKVLVFGN